MERKRKTRSELLKDTREHEQGLRRENPPLTAGYNTSEGERISHKKPAIRPFGDGDEVSPSFENGVRIIEGD